MHQWKDAQMDVNTYSIEYQGKKKKKNEKVQAVAYELKDGWFVFYGAGEPAKQNLRVRATDVIRVVLVAE